MDTNIGFFVSVNRMQFFFLTQIKMSSLLNVSNGSKSKEFNLKDIKVFVDNKEQNWFKRAHIAQYLGIACIITSTTKLAEEDIRSRAFL